MVNPSGDDDGESVVESVSRGGFWSDSTGPYSDPDGPAYQLSESEAIPGAVSVAVYAPSSESEGDFATDEEEVEAIAGIVDKKPSADNNTGSNNNTGNNNKTDSNNPGVTKNERQILNKRKRNRARHAARSRKRAAKREAEGYKTVAAAATKGTESTYRPVGSTDLFLRLVRKPPVKVNTVSLGLLKTAFPSGVVANWPKVSKGSFHQAKRHNWSRPTGPDVGPILPLDDVPAWLAKFNNANQRVDIIELKNLEEVVNYTCSVVGSFTSFLLKCVINRQESFRPHSIWIPSARKGDKSSLQDDHKYTTYVVVIPHAGVFVTDYGIVQDGHIRSLVPLPLTWLGIYDGRSVEKRSFVKHVVSGPQTIYQIVWTPGKLKGRKPKVLSHPIQAFQINDRDPRAPLIPPNCFFDHNSKSGHVGSYNHAEGLSTVERKEMFREQFQDSTTRYVHCRRYVAASVTQRPETTKVSFWITTSLVLSTFGLSVLAQTGRPAMSLTFVFGRPEKMLSTPSVLLAVCLV